MLSLQTIKNTMKNNLLKTYLLGFFLLSDFVIFAQGPGDTSDDCLECDETPASPINGKILWLLVAGILFAMYTYNKNRKRA